MQHSTTLNKETLENTLLALKQTEEMIYYAFQFKEAVLEKDITPNHFKKNFIVTEEIAKNQIIIDLDWSKYPDIFKNNANVAFIYIVSHAIIICKESYPECLWVDKTQNSDLYAAQTILQLVRNNMGHIKAASGGIAFPLWDIKNKDHRNKCFEVKEIGVRLDTTNLQGKPLKLSDFGGLGSFLKVLNYLAKDIEARLSKITTKG